MQKSNEFILVGKLIIFSAPSGSGKTTVVQHLLKKFSKQLGFSISATTRKPRPTETNGREYYFLEPEDFNQKISNHEFLEFEQVYSGIYYGTLWSEVHRIWNEGKAVIFDVDVIGGVNLKKQFGDNALSVFLRPPSLEILMQRLRARSTEVEHQLNERINKAQFELGHEDKYDIVLINDVLQQTLLDSEKIILEFLEKD